MVSLIGDIFLDITAAVQPIAERRWRVVDERFSAGGVGLVSRFLAEPHRLYCGYCDGDTHGKRLKALLPHDHKRALTRHTSYRLRLVSHGGLAAQLDDTGAVIQLINAPTDCPAILVDYGYGMRGAYRGAPALYAMGTRRTSVWFYDVPELRLLWAHERDYAGWHLVQRPDVIYVRTADGGPALLTYGARMYEFLPSVTYPPERCIGAGDVAFAAFVGCLLRNEPLETSFYRAMQAAAAWCAAGGVLGT